MPRDPQQIVWSVTYSVRVKEVDEQHKVLLDILNAVTRASHDAMSERKLHHLLWQKLDELNEYAAFHFIPGERLMQEFLPADSSMARHISQHRQYWVSIDDFKQRGRHNEAGVLPQLAGFLNSWWLEHIQGTDVQMGKELNARGVN